jgi:epoxyqueuosine reductase
MNYLPADRANAQARNPARVASYALGEDYHDVIPERLDSLVESIEDWVGGPFSHRYYTDTGPLLERDLAQRAGLGWIGKNTCLIHPQKGSYYFLAELLLEFELPADEPMRVDHCGSCTRCLEACPTQCILPDRTLDARRCISYLTIELKGEIPAQLREQIGNWVFGCDICQQVCPWNQRFAVATEESAYQPLPIIDGLSPEAFLNISEQEYQDALRGSPLKRAKRRGLARNATVVAGNQADPAVIDTLKQTLLADPEPLPRQHAAWALGRFKEKAAVDALRLALKTETSKEVRSELQTSLADISEGT